MTKFPLLDLFYQLQAIGLPVTIDQYYLAVDALSQTIEVGLDISDELAVKQLCSTLWVKSKQQKDLFDECWGDWKENSLSQTIQGKSSVIKPTLPEEVNQDNSNVDDTAVSSEKNRQGEKEEADKLDSSIHFEDFDVVTSIKRQKNSTKFQGIDYFPVRKTELQQSWEKLMQKLPEVIPTQLDIPATVTDVCQRFFFEKPIFTTAQTKDKEVVLLIDQQGSMVPFHPFCRQLVNTWKNATIYYFHNFFTYELYHDHKCRQGESIKSILKKLSKEHNLIIIVSDAGAARQHSVYSRYEETYDFLQLIIPKAPRLAWLNPLPRFRWQDNTAEEIAKIDPLVPMFSLESGEFQQMIQWLLYGKPSIKQFLKDANNKAKEEWSEHQSGGLNSWDLGFDARGRIGAFKEQFKEPHLDFASYGAFPLVLTPDLLYCLWNEFFRQSSKETEKPKVPWYAVADLLLSDLCQQVYSPLHEEELYEMEREIRNELLKHCQEKFRKQTLEELSGFLIEYIERQLNKQSQKESLSSSESELYEVQRWTALSYTKPYDAAKDLASKLQQAYLQNNKAELVRLSEVAETFVEPLKDYQPLLIVARGYAATARGDKAGAEASKNELKQEYSSYLVNDEIEVAGVLLELPDIVKIPLQKFSFEVVTVNRSGEIINRETGRARYFTEDLGNGMTLDMVYIPGGTFMMGAPETEKCSNDNERPQHQVTVPTFFMGKYKVTQAQWKAVAALPQVERELQPDPSRYKGDNYPIERVSWYDAVEFCARLSNRTGRQYRLPSEAEWEYACRAGTSTPFHFGETITSEIANYNADCTYGDAPQGEHRHQTTPVGIFRVANAFGLYDMHGNVDEWCLDDWHPNYEDAPTDGSAWFDNNDDNLYQKEGRCVMRGGSWFDFPEYCRSAFRYDSRFGLRSIIINTLGFRVVCGVRA